MSSSTGAALGTLGTEYLALVLANLIVELMPFRTTLVGLKSLIIIIINISCEEGNIMIGKGLAGLADDAASDSHGPPSLLTLPELGRVVPEVLEKVRSCESKVATSFLKENPDSRDRLLVSTFASECLAG